MWVSNGYSNQFSVLIFVLLRMLVDFINKSKSMLLVLSVVLLSSCTSVNQTKKTLSPLVDSPSLSNKNKSDSPDIKYSSAINSLKSGVLNKKQGSSGTKLIENSGEGFYASIESCDMGSFRLRDLPVEEVRVSNHQLSTVTTSLGAMGYKVVNLQTPDYDPSALFSCDELPVVVVQSIPEELKLTFTGKTYNEEDDLSESETSSGAISSLSKSNAGELDSFLVYYHPDQKMELQKLKWLVSNKLDVPSAQVYIETMVLDVREEDSKEFGIDFQKGKGNKLLSLSTLNGGESSLDFIKNTFTDGDTGAKVFTPGYGESLQLKALIDEGKAEVLSRPSVLAISNRQAIIQIVDVIQTAELSSTLSEGGGLEVSSYQFEPLLIGITLNLKPRVSADRKWLTLEIDATVESEDDENSGEAYASSDSGRVLLAEKQGSTSKKVRTFARIPDRTPIIIGGLVSKVKEKIESRVPILSSIPLLGKLFTSVDDEVQKREIIIVLTPYILDEKNIGIGSNQPANHVMGRVSDSILFKNRYLINNDDLFDLSYFENDDLFMRYRDTAIAMVKNDENLRFQFPFVDYADHSVPGAKHLINKMLFDIVTNSQLGLSILNEDIIFSGMDAKNNNLKSSIDKSGSFKKGKKIISSLTDTGVTYDVKPAEHPNINELYRITLSNNSDVERLKMALFAKGIIALNGGYDGMKLTSLYPGKELKLPKYKKGERLYVSKDVMEIFLDSRDYYQSVLKKIDESYQKIDETAQLKSQIK